VPIDRNPTDRHLLDDLRTPSVDVLLATFNGRRFVQQQVESITQQTYADIRLVLCDDCSSDGTEKYVDSLAGMPNTIVLHNQENIGPEKTFERLLGHVTSPYFCFSDQDDVWLPTKVEKLLGLLQREGLLLVYSDLEVVGQSLEPIARSMWRYTGSEPLASHCLIPYLLRNPVSGCALLADSRLIPACLPFPSQIPMHDWWVTLRAVQEGRVGFLPEATVKYRQHGVNALGAIPSGARGLARRLEARRFGLLNYAAYRSERRIALARCLNERKADRNLQEFLRFVDQAWVGRILAFPFYLTWLVRNASELGLRAALKEALMNVLPRRTAGARSA
jgi:glycosyltransferase involved in cell wall biosynthesis